ncbi:MAG: hypothetical protein A2516_04455 [Alphaproteobacteria bacterium RIFOXYD12_FULL_60_8]|nr:MAG: hypothetical protein A2516_04455 [Alphaproteobacteria bacterium RIFOXYD12_FULL_60_8]
MSVFYDSYGRYKDYATPILKDKHVRRLDAEYWAPATCSPELSYLEIGCGTGLMLSYLRRKGVDNLLGIDLDPKLKDVLPAEVKDCFRAVRVEDFLAAGAKGRTFDRVILFDVLEHFSAEDGLRLLQRLSTVLNPEARVTVKVPNTASPWGAQHQNGDLTHLTRFTPKSLRQLALAAGYDCVGCSPNLDGSARRRATDRLLHGFLTWALLTPPEIWSANFYGVLRWPGCGD